MADGKRPSVPESPSYLALIASALPEWLKVLLKRTARQDYELLVKELATVANQITNREPATRLLFCGNKNDRAIYSLADYKNTFAVVRKSSPTVRTNKRKRTEPTAKLPYLLIYLTPKKEGDGFQFERMEADGVTDQILNIWMTYQCTETSLVLPPLRTFNHCGLPFNDTRVLTAEELIKAGCVIEHVVKHEASIFSPRNPLGYYCVNHYPNDPNSGFEYAVFKFE